MTLDIYQVDAFIGDGLRGNPAAIVPLEEWLEDELMQQIAEENNLSETAFFVKEGDEFRLRWFTPTKEVNLCGHATLGTAYVLFEDLSYEQDEILFITRSGPLKVVKEGHEIVMQFPSDDPLPCEAPDGLAEALGLPFMQCLKGKYHLALYRREEDIIDLDPDFNLLSKLNMNIIVTAKGNSSDFVSRFFAPASGINEDPVTGSSHTILTPFWSRRLEKHKMVAKQISARGGLINCVDEGESVLLSGRAKLYLKGEIFLY